MTDNAELSEALRAAQESFESGDYASAEPVFRQALEVLGDDPDLLFNLGQIYASWGNFSEAIKVNKRLLGVVERSPAMGSDSIAGLLEHIAGLHEKVGQIKEAFEFHGRAAQISSGGANDTTRRDTGSGAEPAAHHSATPHATPGVARPASPHTPPPASSTAQDAGYAFPSESANPLMESVARAAQIFGKTPKAPPSHALKGTSAADSQPGPGQDEGAGRGGPATGNIRANKPMERKGQEPGQRTFQNATNTGAAKSGLENQEEFVQDFLREDGIARANARIPLSMSDEQFSGGFKVSIDRQEEEQYSADPHVSTADDISAPQFDNLPTGEDHFPQAEGTSESMSAQALSTPPSAREQINRLRSTGSGNLVAPRAPLLDVGAVFNPIAARARDSVKDAMHDSSGARPRSTERKGLAVALLIAVVIGGVVFVNFLYRSLPRKTTPSQAFAAIPHRYASADGDRLFRLIDLNHCELAAGKERLRVPYRFYLGDLRDGIDIGFGSLSQKQYWMTRVEQGYQDQDGNILYFDNGPAQAVREKMQATSQAAEMYYLKNKAYPGSLEDLSETDLTYKNPYTRASDKPRFQKLSFGDKTTSDKELDFERSKLTNLLLLGTTWNDAPELAPGAINCAAATFKSPRGDIQQFLVQGCDGSGKPLSGSQARTSYFILLEDGKEKRLFTPALPFGEPSLLRPATIWLIEDKPDDKSVFMMRYGGATVFGCLAFFMAILWGAARPRGIDNFLFAIPFAFFALAALLYGLHKFLPF